MRWKQVITTAHIHLCSLLPRGLTKNRYFQQFFLQQSSVWCFKAENFCSEYAPAALLDAGFGPLGRNQHPARRGKILFDCHPDLRLPFKGGLNEHFRRSQSFFAVEQCGVRRYYSTVQRRPYNFVGGRGEKVSENIALYGFEIL